MNSAKVKRSLSHLDRLFGRKRTQTWPPVPLTEVGRINGCRNSLTLATIPERDSSVKSAKTNSPGRLRAGTIADLRAPRVQDEQLRTIILDVLTSYLAQFSEYNHNLFGRLGPLLSELIKVRVEEESRETHKRYKIVSQVYIGAVLEDGIDAATQCLWTPCCDKFATASYGTKTLFAVGIVFAVQL